MTAERCEFHALHRRMIERGVVAAKRSHPSASCWAAYIKSWNARMDGLDADDRAFDAAQAHELEASA